uniref:Ig-like domain-containing protein n=1 Tax=Pelusios castaneus TaxID=367368 RepID=A0A8C8S037_9SAUR
TGCNFVLVLLNFAAEFSVIGPHEPVVAILGQDIVLPCHLSPMMSAANMEVRWFRSQFSSFVHLYRDGTDQYEGQMPEYRGRTEFSKAGLTDGNVPLRILNVKHSDEGQYLCFVRDDTFYEETILELKIAGHRHICGESAVQAQLRGSRRNYDTFGIISRAMMEKGYDRDTVQCRSKVKELRISYQRAKEANQRSGSAPATCRYYKEIEAILSGDPTTTAKSPMDTSATHHPVNARAEQDEDIVKEEEMKDDTEESATACSQELFCTPAETSAQGLNCSVSSEAAEGGSSKFLLRATMAPAKILSGMGVLAGPRCARSLLCIH